MGWLKKELRAYIEAELRGYHETMLELAQLRDEIAGESAPPPDGMPKGSETSDPTWNKTMKIITCRRLNQMHRTIYSIGRVIQSLPPDKQKLIQLKYWTRPQTLTDVGIAMELHCGRNTYFRWRNEICRQVAKELGLM